MGGNSMSGEIVFVERVPGRREFYDWDRVVGVLKSRPKEWARIRESDTRTKAYQIAASITHGRIPEFRPANTFEAVARQSSSGDGTATDVYARYVGEATQ